MSDARSDGRLDSALWAAQVTLFTAFGLSGFAKALVAAADLQGKLGLFGQVPAAVLPLAGGVELLTALAVLIPAATRVAPGVSTFSAAFLAGLALLGALLPATGALLAHPAPNLAAAALAAFVAWGRAARLPLAPGWEGDPREEVERRVRELGPGGRARNLRSVA